MTGRARGGRAGRGGRVARGASRGSLRSRQPDPAESQQTDDQAQAEPSQLPGTSSTTPTVQPPSLSEPPAPTPIVPRGSSSSTPAPISRLRSAPSRDSAPPTATSVRPGGLAKFRPKNVRREEAERDSLAQEELKKQSEHAADDAREKKKLFRAFGRGRGRGRGRGNAMTSRPMIVPGFGGPGGDGGNFSDRSRYMPRGGSYRGRQSHPDSIDDASQRFVDLRINADRMGAKHEEEDEGEDPSKPSLRSGTLPIGISRKEHKSAEVIVATTAELEGQAEDEDEEEDRSMWMEGDEPVPEAEMADNETWHAAPQTAVRVKTEPGDDENVLAGVEAIDFDANRKLKGPEADPKKRMPLKKKPKPILDLEDERAISDVRIMMSELGAAAAAAGEEGEDETSAPQPIDKEGRIYLFQFPPIMPPLHVVPKEQVRIKEEESDAPALGRPRVGGASQKAPEDDEPQDSAASLEQGGFVGRLVVRKSGAVELDWGGIPFEVGPAIARSHISSAVLVEYADEKATGPEEYGGRAIGMGKVMGQFNLVPKWEEEKEWIIDPAELVIPEEAPIPEEEVP